MSRKTSSKGSETEGSKAGGNPIDTDTAEAAPVGIEAWAEHVLKGLADQGNADIDIMEGALALAVFDAPAEALDQYRRHLADMAGALGKVDVADDAPAEDRLAALNHVLFGLYGYSGDTESYDDLQNANLIRVMDRRRGLPVALGILMLHLARGRGWTMRGLDFPGHFLLQLDGPGERLIVDPFNGGTALDASDLRALLKAASGNDAELTPDHYAAVSDRDILLRLQNNIKLRLVQAKRIEAALGIVDAMLMLAPEKPWLWREAGLMNAHIGRLKTAVAALETYIDRETRPGPRSEAQAVIDGLRGQMN
ncbi:tetratricopeptide repeat protein [Rhodospirillaceae bacterium KN72]|uniref:Tetratricopeptide repeat protein n=1 Tax=Pacificispira spongiicola TaxID=2729598 RepID=A0A7Y0HEL6_9PROT|nr:transglutaminase-like domain-containing protein [Pacificispira spongiicola]NMM44991.1 tetratricopeptide repeat protein [Pacificispira spongiicola]